MKTPPVLFSLLIVVSELTLSQEQVWRISWFDVVSNQYVSTEAIAQFLQGDSLAVTQDSNTLWIPIASLTAMRSQKPASHGLRSAIVGAGIGAGLGYVTATIFSSNANDSPFFQGTQKESAKPWAIAIGGLVGCGIGAAVGSSSGSIKYDLSSMSPEKKRVTLQAILTTENK